MRSKASCRRRSTRRSKVDRKGRAARRRQPGGPWQRDMDDKILKDLFLKSRKQYVKLLEFFDLTEQLAEAVDRQDEVSVQMLLHMREDPINSLKELEDQIHNGVLKLDEEDAIRAHQLLLGGAPQSEDEEALCKQIAQNRRLLDRSQELDRRLSLRIGNRHSFYTKFRSVTLHP